MGLDQQGRQAAGVVLRPKVHTVRRDIIKHDGLAAPQRISSMLKGFGFHWIMGRHVSTCQCNGKEGSNFSDSHTVRTVGWHWDVLAVAGRGVIQTEQSGDDDAWGGKAYAMSWHRLWHSAAHIAHLYPQEVRSRDMKTIPTRQLSGHLCSYGSMYGQVIWEYLHVQDVLSHESTDSFSLWELLIYLKRAQAGNGCFHQNSSLRESETSSGF